MIYENYKYIFTNTLWIVAGLFFIDIITSTKLTKYKEFGRMCLTLTFPIGLIAIFLPLALQKDVGLKAISDQITVSGTKVSIDPLPEDISYNDLKDDSGSIKYISKHERNTFQFQYDSKYEVGKLVTKEGYHRGLSYEDSQYLIERGAKVDK